MAVIGRLRDLEIRLLFKFDVEQNEQVCLKATELWLETQSQT